MKAATISRDRINRFLTGVNEAAAPAACSQLITRETAPVTFLLTSSHKLAERWAEEIEFLTSEIIGTNRVEARILPDLPLLESEDPETFDSECDRLSTLTRLKDFRDEKSSDQRLVIVTTPRGLVHPVPPLDKLVGDEISLSPGSDFPFQNLIDRLASELQYDSEAICETPGQFAIRGGLVDLYPVNANQPYRIDFYGDRIESIRTYDPTTQRSLGEADRLTITAVPYGRSQTREQNIYGYLGDRINWILWEPARLFSEFPSFFSYPEGIPSPVPNFREVLDLRSEHPDSWCALSEFETEDPVFGTEGEKEALFTEPLSGYRTYNFEREIGIDRFQSEQEARGQFLGRVLQWEAEGYAVFCVTPNQAAEERLREILNQEDKLRKLSPGFLRGNLQEGFRLIFRDSSDAAAWSQEIDRVGLVVVSDSEIFGRYRKRLSGSGKRLLPTRSQVDQLLDFSELAENDTLVHMQHGICAYRGLSKMIIRGAEEEVLSLEFDEGITLHLPLSESHLLTRYVGLSKVRPKLARLGTNTWDKTRQAAERATLDFAAELLNLQAQRNLIEGHACGPDTDWQREFEQSFIYRETPDQLKAIEEIKRDLELPRPVDRLICGDVGFGKTEVALRAAFKVVMEGRQVAVLVPTTVLAQQHLNTFRERMIDYPIIVEMISRFRTRRQQSQILPQLQSGGIDVIIGTHRLLGRDIHFKDLGLLVIDEEHRFGVRHKEKLKRLKENVDVMTMSATPIPRTLYLALMGARDLSVIETPPSDRLPIKTDVKSYSVEIVKDSISYEAARGGQVFYLHNRVETIDSVATRLRELLPDLRIAVGHGQMEERDLEDIMTRFVAGEFDVLVCTTIIESGLDIPNCNTIIIEGADRFGLSQLYQLRGRVGRFKRQAYAYLLLHRHTQLIDQARKRLSALRQYSQLGAGFKIAMRDLELRGAGNLLGAQQSGHIAGVGFELYCHLLRQSIARLKGDKGAKAIRANLRLDFVNIGKGDKRASGEVRPGFAVLKEEELEDFRIGNIEAYIPSTYLPETRLRIDFYRQLALTVSQSEVREIREALEDRFGPIPKAIEALLLVTEIRCLAEHKGLLSVETEGDRLKCLKASAQSENFIKTDGRFPRLTKKSPLPRLREIRTFLSRL